MPAHHRFRLFVGLRDFLHHRLHLLGTRLQAFGAHELADDQTQRDAVFRLRAEHLRIELNILRLRAPLLQALRRPLHQSLRFDLHERLRQRELRALAQRLERLVLDLSFDLALQLELQVRLDFGAKRGDAAAGDPERLRKSLVERRHVRFGEFFCRQREVRDFAGHVLAVIVGRKRKREVARFTGDDAGRRRLEVGQHPPFADDDWKILGLSAGKRDAVDGPREIDDDAIARLRRSLHRRVFDPLLAQHFEGAVDVGCRDFAPRAIDHGARNVGNRHIRINLEHSGKFERLL